MFLIKTNHKKYQGGIFSVIIGGIAYFTSPYIPSMSQVLMGFLLGILIGNFTKVPTSFESGISFTGSKMLELSIILVAFGINYTHIAALGWHTFSSIFLVVLLVLLATIFLAKIFHCPGSTGWLVGYGTAICGSSAIAALAPSVSKNKGDIGIAMAVVNFLGSIGMIFLPLILTKLNTSNAFNGFIIGGSLHSVGNVAGAGFSLSNEIGETALTIKLARVALLSPTLILFNFFVRQEKIRKWDDFFRLPWYLWSFISVTVFTTFVSIPQNFLDVTELLGKITMTVAMTANGLSVSFRNLYQTGRKGIIFGILIFMLQAGFLLLLWNVSRSSS